jgi:hypothetical protein
MSLEFSDLDSIRATALKQFEERVGCAGDNRALIERDAFKLESQLEQFYSFTAVLERRSLTGLRQPLKALPRRLIFLPSMFLSALTPFRFLLFCRVVP